MELLIELFWEVLEKKTFGINAPPTGKPPFFSRLDSITKCGVPCMHIPYYNNSASIVDMCLPSLGTRGKGSLVQLHTESHYGLQLA